MSFNLRYWRPIATVIVLVLTVTAFVYYFATHHAVREQLASVSPLTLLMIMGLYLLTVVALALVTLATLRLCRVNLAFSESTLLTAYSSIINFFGPLQSGPAFRAVYLKKKHGLKLRDYTAATLAYYFFFGSFSVLFLLSGLLKWWLLLLAAAIAAFAWLERRNRRVAARLANLNLSGWYLLALATFSQVVIVALIYFTELRSVAPGTGFSQAIIYTGASNLALFVSLTPGAIGFRESFLLFSQRLHHIGPTTIVAANIIDRAMYIVLLLVMALVIFATHARRQLRDATED